MKISLSQSDLNTAVANHVVNSLGFPAGTSVDAKFSLTGKTRDIVSAEVEIYLPGQPPKDAPEAPKAPETTDSVF